jgi:DNA-binding Xre family transcriptional regulator
MKVNSRLRVLVAERELATGHKLGIRALATQADVSVSVVQGLLNNNMRRVPLDDLAKLCAYFHCQTCDILVYTPDNE